MENSISLKRKSSLDLRVSLSPKSLSRLALFCAVVVYVALILGAQTVMFAAGITAIIAVWAAEEISSRQKKGGDR